MKVYSHWLSCIVTHRRCFILSYLQTVVDACTCNVESQMRWNAMYEIDCLYVYIALFFFVFIPSACARWCPMPQRQFVSIPIGPAPWCWLYVRLPFFDVSMNNMARMQMIQGLNKLYNSPVLLTTSSWMIGSLGQSSKKNLNWPLRSVRWCCNVISTNSTINLQS